MFEAYPGYRSRLSTDKALGSWRAIIVDLSQYMLEALRRDEEIVLYRGAQSNHSGLPSILLLAPISKTIFQ
jgi:hypothetical protein